MMGKMPRWTEQDLATAKRLVAADATGEQCQQALGRSRKACYERVRIGISVEARSHYKTPTAARVPDAVREEAKVRKAAPVRNISAFVFGDPPVGYSALERRS